MELQAFLVLCGVGVAGIAVLLLMGLFSTSGTSYEEAIAQQRKATTELLALAENKNKTKKSNKKTNKKLSKKEKNKENSAPLGSEAESEAPVESGVEDDTVPAPVQAPAAKTHVEFCPPVVVDVPLDTPPNVKIRKRGKDPKVKPILLNKEDPSCVSDPHTPQHTNVVNHFEEMHPKDDFELLHSTLAAEKAPAPEKEEVEKRESKPAKLAKGRPVAKTAPSEVKEEVMRERYNSDTAKDSKKAKKIEKKAIEEAVESQPAEVVLPLNVPQPSELTTEKLLKQALGAVPAQPTPSPPGGKPKKKKAEPNVLSLMAAAEGGGVNVGELVRVVREAALSRTEIQILTDALLNKHHDPLPQHSEWTEGPNDPMQKLKKQLADKEKALADEIEASQALHAKLKELRTNLNAERTRAAASARAAEQASGAARAELHTLQVRLQRLLDENHALTNEKHLLQSKLSADAEAQAQRLQMEMHIQRLSEAEGALLSQLSALQAELNGAVVELGQARIDVTASREALLLAQQHAADLAQQLQDANRAYSELEQHAQQEMRLAQERLVAINELQNEVQRLANHAQSAEANLERAKEDADKKIQQLSSEVSSLVERLAGREAELAEIKQLKAVPAQNGLSPENEQQKAAELAKVESVVEALRAELVAAQRSSREQREQLTRLQEQLKQHQDKNNELRTKNWKVMEALQSAEKALQTRASSAMSAQDTLREAIAKSEEAQYNEMANVLRAVCPSAAPSATVGRDWLHAFAENLKKEMQNLQSAAAKETARVVQVAKSTATAPVDDRVKDLTVQKEHLQGLVDKYKRIIEDTEGVLSRLQQNVSREEQRWEQQLADKQRELDELRQRTVLQMQSKIDALQAELQQAKSAGHSHSFADAERLTEERLMSGLSEKHVESCNGPLQVGLDEK